MSDPSEESGDENFPIIHPSIELDLYPEQSVEDAASSDSESEDNVGEDGEFDTNLPTTHKYLGRLENVSGYTLFDDGEVLSLLAIYTNTLVFPGFTLPLVLNSQVEQSIMQNFIAQKNVFALVCADSRFSQLGTRLYKYGVTMEVFESFLKHGTLYLKARGRQRCKIVPGKEIRHLGGRLQQITVKVLAEPNITSPVCNTQLLTLKLRRQCPTSDYDSLITNYKYRRYHLAQYPNATWIYDHNEVCYYVKLMLDKLERFYIKEIIPTDPVSLSYWFIQNFQLAHDERLQLMKLDSALERLRLELRFLQMERLICCGMCKAEITNQNKVFAMSKDGVQSNYCNPGGHVYETVTVSEARNYDLIGEPSKEFSWFPGFWWTIMQCRLCRVHIGWQFTSKHLQPRKFYGLAKSNLDIKIVGSESHSNHV